MDFYIIDTLKTTKFKKLHSTHIVQQYVVLIDGWVWRHVHRTLFHYAKSRL